MGKMNEQWNLHFKIEQNVPESPNRIGYAALQQAIEVGQRGRVKRAVSTLVALDVLQWEGVRRGRAVAQGSRSLQAAIDAGLSPMPDREIELYPLLAGALDEFITRWHSDRNDPIDTSGGNSSVDDGVTTYNTSSLRALDQNISSVHTRPDMTVIVDLEYPNLGSWNEVHAIEVKPYWAVDRAALFEAAAQSALRRCTFSWLLVWVPKSLTGHFTAPQIEQIKAAENALDAIKTEASQLGIGLIIARSLEIDATLDSEIDPRRLALEPKAANDLFASLGRSDSVQ